MSQTSDLQMMVTITDMQYQRQLHAFQKVANEENKLRAELAKIDEHLRISQEDANGTSSMSAIGADVLWLGWVGRTKTQLNLQLARVLAIKEHQKAQLRKAFAKVETARNLLDQIKLEQRNSAQKAELDTAIELSVFGGNQ